MVSSLRFERSEKAETGARAARSPLLLSASPPSKPSNDDAVLARLDPCRGGRRGCLPDSKRRGVWRRCFDFGHRSLLRPAPPSKPTRPPASRPSRHLFPARVPGCRHWFRGRDRWSGAWRASVQWKKDRFRMSRCKERNSTTMRRGQNKKLNLFLSPPSTKQNSGLPPLLRDGDGPGRHRGGSAKARRCPRVRGQKKRGGGARGEAKRARRPSRHRGRSSNDFLPRSLASPPDSVRRPRGGAPRRHRGVTEAEAPAPARAEGLLRRVGVDRARGLDPAGRAGGRVPLVAAADGRRGSRRPRVGRGGRGGSRGDAVVGLGAGRRRALPLQAGSARGECRRRRRRPRER